MRPRSPALARFLGLWTAGWLAVLLVLGMVRFGDPALQWPVLVVPVIWALVALRPRTGGRRPPAPDGDEWPEHPDDDRGARGEPGDGGGQGWTGEGWTDEGWTDEHPRVIPPAERTDTVERPALRRRSDGESNRR